MASSTTDKLPPENAKTATSKQMSSGPLAVAKLLIRLFSTSTRQREPPTPQKTTHIRLITISVSHYCEKVRWALDRLEASDDNPYYYTEDGHPPGLQAYETLKASNEEASITPMIIWKEDPKADSETVLYDSVKILKKFWPELYPKDIESDIDAMEADFGKRLGAALRCYAYHEILADVQTNHEFFVDMAANEKRVAKVERIITDKFLERGFAEGILKALKINKESSDASLKALRDVFSEVSKALETDGTEYIMDGYKNKTGKESFGFTAADLTFAALAYPFIRPPQMEHWLMDESRTPKSLNDLSEELRATTAGKHVLKMYEKHRLFSDEAKAASIVDLKVAPRDKYPWQW